MREIPTVSAVIFDMDGVIFDSERATFAEWKAIADREGLAEIEAVYRRCIGVNSRRSREIFLEAYGGAFPYERFDGEVSASYHAKYDGGRLPRKAGAAELLQALRGAGKFLALASSTRVATVRRQLEEAGLLGFFDRVIGGDMIARSKPAPDIFLAAIEGTAFTPADCAVIEDSFNGIRAAHAAGMCPIMVPDMLPPDEEMRSLARAIVPDLASVRPLLIP